MTKPKICIGIDATNISSGGGLTHLFELLENLNPKDLNIRKVIVWSSSNTNKKLPNKDWLIKKSPSAINKNILIRTIWQTFFLTKSAKKNNCDVLFVPGGIYLGSFKPIVSMSQNLLPFDKTEFLRFGFSRTTLRFILLRIFQSRTFKKSDGIIFLTKYAREVVKSVVGDFSASTIIPHGISSRFFLEPENHNHFELENYSKPIKIIYVSIVNHYKHQWNVVKAVEKLRKEHGYSIKLDLIGPSYPSAKKKLQRQIILSDLHNEWVKYYGSVPHGQLQKIYFDSDIAVFASSCENLPIILLEKMASGLPIACSNKRPMPDVLENAGLYFDPENHEDISFKLLELIKSKELRISLSKKSYEKAQKYNWRDCSESTFKYLTNVINIK